MRSRRLTPRPRYILTVCIVMAIAPQTAAAIDARSLPANPDDENGVCRYFDLGDIVRHGIEQKYFGLQTVVPDYDERRAKAMTKHVFAIFDYNRNKLRPLINSHLCNKRQRVELVVQINGIQQPPQVHLYEMSLEFKAGPELELLTVCFGAHLAGLTEPNKSAVWRPDCRDRRGQVRQRPPLD